MISIIDPAAVPSPTPTSAKGADKARVETGENFAAVHAETPTQGSKVAEKSSPPRAFTRPGHRLPDAETTVDGDNRDGTTDTEAQADLVQAIPKMVSPMLKAERSEAVSAMPATGQVETVPQGGMPQHAQGESRKGSPAAASGKLLPPTAADPAVAAPALHDAAKTVADAHPGQQPENLEKVTGPTDIGLEPVRPIVSAPRTETAGGTLEGNSGVATKPAAPVVTVWTAQTDEPVGTQLQAHAQVAPQAGVRQITVPQADMQISTQTTTQSNVNPAGADAAGQSRPGAGAIPASPSFAVSVSAVEASSADLPENHPHSAEARIDAASSPADPARPAVPTVFSMPLTKETTTASPPMTEPEPEPEIEIDLPERVVTTSEKHKAPPVGSLPDADGPRLAVAAQTAPQVVASDHADASPVPHPSSADAASASPTGAPATPTAPHLALPPVANQIAQAFRTSADGSVEVRLSPEELGTVRMTLHHHDGGLSVQISADRPDTLDLIRRNLHDLAREFRDAGQSNLSFSFSEGRPDPHPQRGTAAGFEPDLAAAAQTDAPPIAPIAVQARDRLDLRL